MVHRSIRAHRGATVAKRELARALRRDMTPQERRLWDALRHDALGVRVRRQHPALGYILDFYIPRCLLAIELDGACHDPVADAARDAALAQAGVRVLRFANDVVDHDLAAVLRAIRAAVQR